MAVAAPSLKVERAIHREGHRYVIGCDEVGRGALAGPVAVGVAVVEVGVRAFPPGLRDSKMLSEKRREELAPRARKWARHCAVGLTEAWEVDELGLSIGLGLAGRRALDQVPDEILDDAVILLDGSWDWLNPMLDAPRAVRTRIKADRDCASVSAASVIAKVHRDRIMIDADLELPGYGWPGNKGYASTGHFAALAELGPSRLHRRTWLRPPELDLQLDGLEGLEGPVVPEGAGPEELLEPASFDPDSTEPVDGELEVRTG